MGLKVPILVLFLLLTFVTMSDNLKKLDKVRFKDKVTLSSQQNPRITHRQDYSETNKAVVVNVTQGFLLDLHEAHQQTGFSYTSILDAQINIISLFKTDRLEKGLQCLCGKVKTEKRQIQNKSAARRDEFSAKIRQISILKNEVLDANKLTVERFKFQQENVQLRARYDVVLNELQEARRQSKKYEKRTEKIIERLEVENEKLAGFLKHIVKTRTADPENTGRKLDEVQEQQYNRKLESLKCNINSSLWFAKSFDLVPTKITLKSTVTEKDVHLDLTGQDKEKLKFDDMDAEDQLKIKQLTLILDEFAISNSTYHELKMVSDGLPEESLIAQCREDASKFIKVERLPGNKPGAYVSLTTELSKYIEENPDEVNIKFKFAGDGAKVSRIRNYVVFSIVPVKESCDQSVKSHRALAILNGDEKYEDMRKCCAPVLRELNHIIANGLTVGDKHYQPAICLGGDMKFLQTILGINVASGSAYHSCIYCKVHKDNRGDMSKPWDYYDQENQRRNFTEAGETGVFGQKYDTLIHIDLSDIIPCTLHLLLRVTDVLESALIQEMKQRDIKAKVQKQPQRYLEDFIKLVNDAGISYNVWESSGSKSKPAKEQKTSLTGNAKLKLLQVLPDMLLQSDLLHENTKHKICQLWKDFLILYKAINDGSLQDPTDLFTKAKQWILDYQDIAKHRLGYETITPYMHIMVHHIPKYISLHGGLSRFSGQGVEKLNDVCKQLHHKKTSKWDGEKDTLQTRKRIEELSKFRRVKRPYNLSEEGLEGIRRARAAKKQKIADEKEAANEDETFDENVDYDSMEVPQLKEVLASLGVEKNSYSRLRSKGKLISLIEQNIALSIDPQQEEASNGETVDENIACPVSSHEHETATVEDENVDYDSMEVPQLKEVLASLGVEKNSYSRLRSKGKLISLIKQNTA